MIKGNSKEPFVQYEDILRATNGGYDIFAYYLGGKVGRSMKRPWGKQESKPSWGIFPKNGIWFWKDHATEDKGTAIHFVEQYFNLSFEDARDKVAWDFGLSAKGKEINISPVKVTWSAPDIERDYSEIKFDTQPFTAKHHAFWNIAEVTEDHLRKINGWAVKRAVMNKKRLWIDKDEIVFAFYAEEEDAVKLYFPERTKEKKFRNNVSYHYLWNFENVGECENLIIQKSFKDMAVTSMIEPCTIATQAEAIQIFNPETVDRINGISKSPWVWYGSDWDGVKKCKEITDTNKWKYINTPKKYLPDVNDTYSFVRMHNEQNPGTGLKALEEFMKTKKLLK